MTRSKVKLEFISNASSRKATFKKRKKGLLKKIQELTTLCAVDACAIIYSPYDSKPEVWPSSTGARRVLSRLYNLPEEDQEKKMLDQESYLRQRVAKTGQLLEKMKKEARVRELNEVLVKVVNGDMSVECLGLNETKELCALAKSTLDIVLRAQAQKTV